MDEPCAECPKRAQVSWCPLWNVYLCVFCRASRTEQELRDSQRKWYAAAAAR
jgi:hypothetical protein